MRVPIKRDDAGLSVDDSDLEELGNAGANDIGISNIPELPGDTTVQEALQSLATGGGSGGVSPVDLASTALGKGASMVGVHDAGGIITATTVEGALAEIQTETVASTSAIALRPLTTNLASTANGKGASTIGIEDVGTHYFGTTVEAALSEAAIATDAVETTANNAAGAATIAQAAADAAQADANAAQITASAALANAAAAEADAQIAIVNAATALANANAAQATANAAQIDATAALAIANAAQVDADAALVNAATALANAATAQTTANSALATANAASAAAIAAQATANTAIANAATAQAAADAAQATANTALANAATAQTTANTAIANAATAQAAADAAQATANTAITNAFIAQATANAKISSVASGDAGLVITTAGTAVTAQQVIAAEWPIANMRIYAVDFVNGLDTNAGFADAAGTSAANYAAACVAAGLVAKKTVPGLAAIWPRIGNGRLSEIIFANGGVSTEQAYADSLEIILNGTYGYRNMGCIVRATGTNTTAGAVAFAGTTNDVDYQGGITATGCNAAGYNPTGGPTTSVIQCLKVGGGAAAIPAEPAAPLGWRIRFDANAPTQAALQNVSREVSMVTGTDTISTPTALPAVPVATDVFYLEQAAVTFPATALVDIFTGAGTTALQLTGIRFTGALSEAACTVRHAFCGATSLAASAIGQFISAQTFVHPILGTRIVGGGFRSEGTSTLTQMPGSCALTQFTSVGLTTLTNCPIYAFGSGSYSAGLNIIGCLRNSGVAAVNGSTVGVIAAPGIPRVNGGPLQFIGSIGLVTNVAITNAGAVFPAIALRGAGNIVVIDGVPSGSVGNTSFGVGFVGNDSSGNLLVLLQTPTVTGTLGDFGSRLNFGLTWAQIAPSGLIDYGGNRILGNAGAQPVNSIAFTGSILGGAGATFSYIANSGINLAANNTTPLRFPNSLRIAARLHVTNISNNATNAVTCKLYKNNIATTMQVTIPAGSAAYTKFLDISQASITPFFDGDDFDLRLDNPAADPGTIVNVSAILGWLD